jgi:prepilin-type N-terminal cleavage/methylation domain-containing protein
MKTSLVSKHIADDSGVTLVEVIIAIVLGSIAAMVLFAVFIGGQGVFIQTRSESGAYGDARVVLSLLANEIRSAGSDAGELGLQDNGLVVARGDSLHLMSDLDGDRAISLSEPPEDVLYVYDSGGGTFSRDTGSGPVVILDRVNALTMQFLDDQGQVLAAQGNGRVDAAEVRAVEIMIAIRQPDGTVEDVEGVFSLRNR